MSATAAQVTIGVPVYRGEEFLDDTLRSIQDQTFPEFEVLISMDGADPVCEEICAKYLRDSRFKLIIQPQRLGWVGNLNWLLAHVTTEFWYFHQQDDLTSPQYLEVLLEQANENPTAALVYSDLVPMGRIEGSFEQPPSVRGATAYIRMMSALHEQFPAFAFRGVTRIAAVHNAGPIPTNAFADFGVDICWLTGVARTGDLLHVPRPLYRKRYHSRNTESKWWEWPQDTRVPAWAGHCVNMLEQVLQIRGTAQEFRMLWLGAIERLTSPRVAAHFLQLDLLKRHDRETLLDCFLEGTRKSKQLDLPGRLEADWRDLEDLARAFYWLPSKEPFQIRNFGPTRVTAGQPFNLQPDGRSAIWVEISRCAEPGLRIQLADNDVLETVLETNVLTAAVPPSATACAGQIALVIVDRDGAARSEPVFLDVVAQEAIPYTPAGLTSSAT